MVSKNSTSGRQAGNKAKTGALQSGMQSSQLQKLFVDELKDIFWAEKALVKSIPKMIKNATSVKLIEALSNHLEETNQQVDRLVEVFESIDMNPMAKKCEAMDGLIKEAVEIMSDCEPGSMRDAGIIAAGQKIEHYEIATYGTLRKFAETLGLVKAVPLLTATLKEEKAADEKLSEVATSAINIEAAETVA